MPLKLKVRNISNEHNRLENHKWWEADQLAIHKHDWGVELKLLLRNNSALVVRVGLDPQLQDFKSPTLTTWLGCLAITMIIIPNKKFSMVKTDHFIYHFSFLVISMTKQ